MSLIKKYILVIIIFVTFLFSTTIFKYNKEIIPVEVKQVFNNKTLGNTTIKESCEEKDLYLMKIYYPKTEYQNLNEYVANSINEVKESFFEEINQLGKISNEGKYELNITFNQYEYKSYISFAFDVMIDLCGAHPYNYIFTVIYDTDSKSIVTINDLIKKDKEFLIKLSEKTYEDLKENESIKEYSDDENLRNGLKPIVSNFENIIFDNDKLVVFINIYQVAPYVAGNFEVAIPYDKIFENYT